MNHIALWQFNVATFLITQILFGVEGWMAWGISAAVAWHMTKQQARGEKRFGVPFGIWLFLMVAMHFGRTA